MLKIGDFSKLTYISVRMLRYYDKMNVLKPAYVDENTGYRFYSVAQIKTVNIIQRLKALGFEIKMIKEIIEKDKFDDMLIYFEEQQRALNLELERLSNASREIENLINDDFKKIEYNVVKKIIPERKVVSVRQILDTYYDEGRLWNLLWREMNEQNIKMASDNCYAVAVYHDKEYKDENVDVEVQLSVTENYKDTDNLKCYVSPEVLVASVTFGGSYDKMTDVTSCVVEWLEINEYELIQPTFNIFHVSPAQDKNPDNWITEACFQIKKK